MSSPESDDTKIFLPSMLRKSGGVFGQTLTNALINKMRPTATTLNTDPKDDPIESELPTDANGEELIEKTDSTSAGKANTLDSVSRSVLLKDVRSQRPKAPFTRPKSTQILRKQLDSGDIPMDFDESELCQEPIVENRAESSFKFPHVQNQSASRQSAFKKNADRAVSIGNIEVFNRLSPDNIKEGSSDEVDKMRVITKVIDKGLQHSKSTEGLNVAYDPPKATTSSSKVLTAINNAKDKENDKGKYIVNDNVQQGVDNQSMKLLKNIALTLAKNVKSIEEDLSSMKTQVRQLVQWIHEIDRDNK